MREPSWRQRGTAPDYRFSLANERTFLAWVRTALAFIAGAVAVDQLAPNLAPGPVRIIVCTILALVGASLAVMAYRRWAASESAMRQGQELPFSWALILLGALVVGAAVVLAVLIVI